MNTTLKTIVIVLVGVIVAAGLFCAGILVDRSGLFGGRVLSPVDDGYGYYNFGPGMRQPRDRWMNPSMNWPRGNRMGTGWMHGFGFRNQPGAAAAPLTLDQAKQAAEKYVASLGLPGLEISEVMIFTNNTYVVVKEKATGIGAFELLVDSVSQQAYPEPGPNMMWNTKYAAVNHMGRMGGMGGMMRSWNQQGVNPAEVSAEMPVSMEQAWKVAQEYIDKFQPGAKVTEDPIKFYGYYTFDYLVDNEISGMLSVNGYNGQVFIHTWHGSFLGEEE